MPRILDDTEVIRAVCKQPDGSLDFKRINKLRKLKPVATYTNEDITAILSDVLNKMDQFKHDETLLEPMDGDWSSYQENKFIDKLEDIVRDEIKKFQS